MENRNCGCRKHVTIQGWCEGALEGDEIVL